MEKAKDHCRNRRSIAAMIRYGQFCPVAKAAEVFGDRWTPIIMRELCFGTRGFGDLLAAAPLISRTVLSAASQRARRRRRGAHRVKAEGQGSSLSVDEGR
jgi:DNA-binding HxlR family transcriptional regulator